MVIPDEESGTYTAQVLEFPGCMTQGNSVQEAYENLEGAAESWIEATLDAGKDIPSPMLLYGYGGKVLLRLPKSLHRQASIAAERDGVSLNQFIVTALAERVGAAKLFSHYIDKLEHQIVCQVTQVVAAVSSQEMKLPITGIAATIGAHGQMFFQSLPHNTGAN
ncbi:MAG: toxin-antitoxin system HicB family antitoxin [bacterium]|nr:toxin-antitoxin system HicB family antitoxin [bacterium]